MSALSGTKLEEARKKIFELRAKGWSVSKIARELGLTHERVTNEVRAIGMAKVSTEAEQRWLDILKRSSTVREAMRIAQSSSDSVYSWIRKFKRKGIFFEIKRAVGCDRCRGKQVVDPEIDRGSPTTASQYTGLEERWLKACESYRVRNRKSFLRACDYLLVARIFFEEEKKSIS